MKTLVLPLWDEAEYSYPYAFSFRPSLYGLLHDHPADGTTSGPSPRPCMLVLPGGGYSHVSSAESESAALPFYRAGWQCFVLTYTVNAFNLQPVMNQPLRDLARAVRLLRSSAKILELDPERIVLCGFSAGAHLAGSLAVHWGRLQDPAWPNLSCRPDAAILSYPVITSGSFAHRGSFECLLGADVSPEQLLDASLEKQVTPDTPPLFLWHTADDQSVPCQNSLLMADACRVAGIPYALHIFSHGRHGMSVATPEWARREWGGAYCNAQREAVLQAAASIEAPLTAEQCRAIAEQEEKATAAGLLADSLRQPSTEVAAWPELALAWMQTIGV